MVVLAPRALSSLAGGDTAGTGRDRRPAAGLLGPDDEAVAGDRLGGDGQLEQPAGEHAATAWVAAVEAVTEVSCAVLARVAVYSAGAVSTASATASPLATAVSAAPLLIKAPGMTADTPSPT
jgi:hypothetical protein